MYLKSGYESEDVETLQWYLNAIAEMFGRSDFYVQDELTGYFGDKTKAAVKNFQKAMGLTVDGIVGDQTWSALEAVMEAGLESGEVTFYTTTGGTKTYTSTGKITTTKPTSSIDWTMIGIGATVFLGAMMIMMSKPKKR